MKNQGKTQSYSANQVVSLFSGCGGADLGVLGGFSFLGKNYSSLSTNIVFANDVDQKACNTYRHNFDHEIMLGDIRDIPAIAIPQHDLLIGGFPCQPFSIVGERLGLNDERGLLFYDIKRIVDHHQPKAFILENVKGLINMDKGNVIRHIVSVFEASDYKVFYKILNAANYGVPQKRERVFIVGLHRSIKANYNFPPSTHAENPRDILGELSEWVALESIMEHDESVDEKYYFSERAVEGLKRSNKLFNKGRAQNTAQPCNTVTTHLAKVSLNGTDPVLLVDPKNEKYRRFTPKEVARIQSFPETFQFLGSDGDIYRQLGNAIPPVMFWHVAKSVIDILNSEESVLACDVVIG